MTTSLYIINKPLRKIPAFSALAASLVLAGCGSGPETKTYYTEQDLGKALFFDPILSRDSTVSCASCHKPDYAFADNATVSTGVKGRKGGRNAPGVMNLANHNFYFWDGRAETLEQQALGPIENPVEMDLPVSVAVRRLKHSPVYNPSFVQVYGKAPSQELLGTAIAAYENSLETSGTAFDRYMNGKDTTAMSASALRGLDIFNNKGRCFDCHFGSDFNGSDKFKNIGLYNGKDLNDPGRSAISGNPKDAGAFKTPGLRNIAKTAPYMHNGMFKTLREVIDYYDQPDKFVPNAINRDTILRKPLGLTETEKKDLEAFLSALSDTEEK